MNKLLNSIWLKSLANERTILWLLVAYGIGTSLIQFYFSQDIGLQTDESLLALNIIHRSPAELLKPLDYCQTAPPLFLLVEKLFSTLIPNSEYGLRLFPLLCFWMSLFLFVRIIKKTTNQYAVCITAVTLFVTSRMLSIYSCETKQYMTEVLVLLTIFWLTIKDYNKWQTKYFALGIAGVIAVFWANVTPIIMATSGLYLCYKLFRPIYSDKRWSINCHEKRQIWTLILVFVCWLIAFAFYYYNFVHEHPLKDYMTKFWGRLNNFLIINPFDPHCFSSIKQAFLNMFSAYANLTIHFSHLSLISFCISIGIIGLYITGIAWIIVRKKIELLILYCLPISLHLGMSALQLYPFFNRFILYTFPCMIIIWCFGIGYILEKVKLMRYEKPIMIFVCVLLCCVFIKPPRLKSYGTKDMLHYIEYASNHETEDINVHVSYSCILVSQYYKDIKFISNRLHLHNPVYAEYGFLNKEIPLDMFSDIFPTQGFSTLKGKNWFLIDTQYALMLDSLGYKKLDKYKKAYLYDCGE